jgi:hypothetical protein
VCCASAASAASAAAAAAVVGVRGDAASPPATGTRPLSRGHVLTLSLLLPPCTACHARMRTCAHCWAAGRLHDTRAAAVRSGRRQVGGGGGGGGVAL